MDRASRFCFSTGIKSAFGHGISLLELFYNSLFCGVCLLSTPYFTIHSSQPPLYPPTTAYFLVLFLTACFKLIMVFYTSLRNLNLFLIGHVVCLSNDLANHPSPFNREHYFLGERIPILPPNQNSFTVLIVS